MIRKISFVTACFLVSVANLPAAPRHALRDSINKRLLEDKDEEVSIWESYPVESKEVIIQILDKISGKVFCKNLKLNETIKFGNIELSLEKAFENGPDAPRESYAFIKIAEKGKVIFNNWLFASSPSVNLFAHATYDIRVNFRESNEI